MNRNNYNEQMVTNGNKVVLIVSHSSKFIISLLVIWRVKLQLSSVEEIFDKTKIEFFY